MDKEKRTESTDSSTPVMNAMKAEMKLLRRTVTNMNKTMEEMRANQEQTVKLLQDQTASGSDCFRETTTRSCTICVVA